MPCPRCATEIVNDACHRCGGSWVSRQALAKRVGATQQRRRARLDWQLDPRAPVTCTGCRRPMETLRLFDVPVERCGSHGVWLERGALDGILRGAAVHARERTWLDAVLDVFWMWG